MKISLFVESAFLKKSQKTSGVLFLKAAEKLYFSVIWILTAQKMKFSIKDFLWSHLLKKSLTENFIFSAVT